jgi:hypothetical protein
VSHWGVDFADLIAPLVRAITQRVWRSQLALFLLAALLSACAAPTSYMGIGLAPSAASPELQTLAQRAQAGDTQAQLDLGIAFEEGRGVEVDLKRAEGFYRMAAGASGGTVWVYVPPVQRGASGRVIAAGKSLERHGLVEASHRLALLKAKK